MMGVVNALIVIAVSFVSAFAAQAIMAKKASAKTAEAK